MNNKRADPHSKGVGYGYVGMWSNGTLGWFMPTHLSTATAPRKWLRHAPDKPAKHPEWSNIGEPSYMCKITIELVLDKNRRPIVRRVKP
jgi:hypothetical protein